MHKSHFNIKKQPSDLFSKPSVVLLVLAAILGAVTGVIGALFQNLIAWVTTLRVELVMSYFNHFLWMIFFGLFMVSAAMAALSYYLVKRFAPEASGSGVQEIEGALSEKLPVRWKHVLPVKFFGGVMALASGMILGREGPTIQIGANLGECLSDFFKVKISHFRHSLLATGAAAGLATAFNAPLAGGVLIIEEMNASFRYTVASISSVLTGIVTAIIAYRALNGGEAVLFIGHFTDVPLTSLWICLLLGIMAGILGMLFNALLLWLQSTLQSYQKNKMSRFLLVGVIISGVCGVLTMIQPQIVSDGFNVVHDIVTTHFSFGMLLYFFIARFILSIMCYISGAPGGIFSPLLGLGALFGILFGLLCISVLPDQSIDIGIFIILGMGALFSATIQAPLTGTILIIEMTMNYQLALPLLVVCGSASIIAKLLGGRPLYSVLLERVLAK